ncbi:MAG: hypothetical protein IMZ52_10420 [Actinobacteria bacterium]|nr:hypothetical protein [Bacteroidota bacterium]MBE3095434.1 hypothetical protein [Actinomycetota bacterium]
MVERNICDLIEIFESMEYQHIEKRDTDDDKGIFEKHFLKNVDGGRLHVCCQSINALATRVVIHYDKFKGHKKDVRHHATYYIHPFVKREEKLLIETLSHKQR